MSRKYRQDPRQVQRQQAALNRELAGMWLAAAEPAPAREAAPVVKPVSTRYEGLAEAELLREVGRDGEQFTEWFKQQWAGRRAA